MSSWDAVTMENPGSPVYRVMDKGPRKTPGKRKDPYRRTICGVPVPRNPNYKFRKVDGELVPIELLVKVAAATKIQAHFRGMIVRNPTGMPLNTWLSLVAGPLEEEEKPKTINERWLEDPIIAQVEPADNLCHPVGWNSTNHYSDMGWQWCGQSCPCCRAKAGDTLGACEICLGKALSF